MSMRIDIETNNTAQTTQMQTTTHQVLNGGQQVVEGDEGQLGLQMRVLDRWRRVRLTHTRLDIAHRQTNRHTFSAR